MFGSVSFNEILLILVLALLIFGPKRLPHIGRTIGRALGEFRRASTDLKRTMESEMAAVDEAVSMPSAAPEDGPRQASQSIERGALETESTGTEPAETESFEDESGAADFGKAQSAGTEPAETS